MNILHLLAPARVGGLEGVVQGLAIAQARRGHAVTVVTIGEVPMTADHPFRIPLDAGGVTVRELVIPHRAYGTERRDVVALCRAVGPDVVHSHGSRPDVVDGEAIRRIGLPTVSTVHGWTGGSLKNRLYEYLHRRSLRRFGAIVAVSEPIARRLAADGVSPDRIHVVRNAFAPTADPLPRAEARKLLDIDPLARVAGWIGRLSREKGIDVFIDAMTLLRGEVSACVVGDGPERASAHSQADRGQTTVIWKGIIPQAGRLLTAFDVFVQSSRTEGTPIALLEAMAAGTPIVATQVGGVPDIVSNDEAILVPSEDPIAIAGAIRSVVADPAAATERARRAKSRLASEFAVDAWLDRHDAIYAQAIARH